ncbi:MAG: hypothetical protein ACYTBZ_29580, partial [Planctomycetota bacterium]
FTGNAIQTSHDIHYSMDFTVSNYRPLAAVASMYTKAPADTEAELSGLDRWRHYTYRGDKFTLSTFQNLHNRYYDKTPLGGETHDIAACVIQSTSKGRAHMGTCGIPPDSNGFRSHGDRSFGYRNVAFHNSGGATRKAWSKPTADRVPIRIFYSHDFKRTIKNGWAFFTDGIIYVAWAPTIGHPIDDPESEKWSNPQRAGRWLKSSHVPGPAGETCVVEVGDKKSSGSFQAFINEILTRNPRPRWQDNKVVYQTKDNTSLEFGTAGEHGYVKLNGKNYDPSTHPRARMPGLRKYTISFNGANITFDFEKVKVVGSPLHRLAANMWFGKKD